MPYLYRAKRAAALLRRCEGELAGVDTAALQRALDLCVPAPAAPAATPCALPG